MFSSQLPSLLVYSVEPVPLRLESVLYGRRIFRALYKAFPGIREKTDGPRMKRHNFKSHIDILEGNCLMPYMCVNTGRSVLVVPVTKILSIRAVIDTSCRVLGPVIFSRVWRAAKKALDTTAY